MEKDNLLRLLEYLQKAPPLEEELLARQLGLSAQDLRELKVMYHYMPYIVMKGKDSVFEALDPCAFKTWKKLLSEN